MIGCRGWTLLDSRIWAKPSDLEVGLEKKREKTLDAEGLREMSVYTVEADEVRGLRRVLS